ncbi:hypothetical protein PanWU01x14_263530 [Parasponia andersonii]|uniref:Uncharacterized protein n=1 Tax=Parasponia andersonii TaxID=3476 RepID=A0A2P5B7V8_PARAD|nr:hypothetical protein PanWU01x14_263530 [Parasponia andersonii]
MEVSIRGVLAEKQDSECGQSLKQSRDEESYSPGSELGSSEVSDEGEDQWHDQLGGSAAEIPPPTGESVGAADDRGGKHGAHPELGRDERGQREAGEETDEEEGGGGVGHGGEVDRRRREEDERGRGQAGSEEVAGRPHCDTGEDRARNGGDPGIADVGGGEVEVVSDDREQRRRGEGGDEAREEGDPGEVEGSHVGFGQGE